MNKVITKGIVLKRIKFGEADMIITVLTPDHGKIRVIAKGVRKSVSKLAGGIELFSESNISFLSGKRDISTLISSRLIVFYKNIITNLEKTNAAYEIIKIIDKFSYEKCESEYYDILQEALKQLNNRVVNLSVINSWVDANLLKVLGHSPNLTTDESNKELTSRKKYNFDFEKMCFSSSNGDYDQNDIKLLRLLFKRSITDINRVEGIQKNIAKCEQLLKIMTTQYA